METLPEAFKGFTVAKEKALLTSDKWSYLVAPDESSNNEVSATLTINDAAKQLGFFGSSWSAWPDASFGDGGFEAALLLREIILQVIEFSFPISIRCLRWLSFLREVT